MITGASSGLGEKLAHRFYDAGCKVVLTARRREDLERVKRNILISTNVSKKKRFFFITRYYKNKYKRLA